MGKRSVGSFDPHVQTSVLAAEERDHAVETSAPADEERKPTEPAKAAPAAVKPGRVVGARPLEEWAKELRVTRAETLLARRVRGWAIGRMVTRDEFIGAVEAAKNVPIR